MLEILQTATTYSQFIRTKLQVHPEWECIVLKLAELPMTPGVVGDFFVSELPVQEQVLEEADFLAKLRTIRQILMLALGVRDLGGLASLEEVMHAMTAIAEEALKQVCTHYQQVVAKTYGHPKDADQNPINLWVIGMGKLGGAELNVSSDIDLIFLYDSDGQTEGGQKSISHHEWFTFVGKKVIKGLAEITVDGFVFRVDMRLRPNGDSGPLVCSLNMLEEYFLVQGREWERYAWIKARLVYPLSDGQQAGLPKDLWAIVKPFVYRKYLDYGIIESIRTLHSQIRHEANLRASQFPDRAEDIKLGVGGIREIEFLVQMYQMIYGGQTIALRSCSTLKALASIHQRGLMTKEVADALLQAYVFFRTLEHRLQWRDDAQIHYLPVDEATNTRLAYSMGLKNANQLRLYLKSHQDIVADLFAKAFTRNRNGRPAVQFHDVSLGFFQFYPEFQKWYEGFIKTQRYAVASASTKQNLAVIFLRLSECETRVSEQALLKFADFVEVILRRPAYLAFMREYPFVIEKISLLFSQSAWGAQYLNQHPQMLDQLIQNETVVNPETQSERYWQEWHQALSNQLDTALVEENDQELALNILRDMHHAEIFHTLLADLGIDREPGLSVEEVSDRLSDMADVVITETLERIWRMIAQKFQLNISWKQIGFGVIAYGKLGGKELGYGSDLDLVFVYNDADPLFKEEYIEYFVILIRRFILWCTTVTSSGILFDIDTRLRPNGVAGLMVSSLSAFSAYQKKLGSNTAWVWEHQALTRARFCAGSIEARRTFDRIREDVLRMPREQHALREEVVQMRQKIREGHPNPTEQFDLKHDAGGMVDIEFMIQYIVLQYAIKQPSLIENVGNIGLIIRAGQTGIIAPELARQVADAYRLFRKKQHQLRLDGHALARVAPELMDEALEKARSHALQLWQQLMT